MIHPMAILRRCNRIRIITNIIGDKMCAKDKILVVDDDELILKIISDWMTLRDWEVSTARDGTEAYDLIVEKKDFNLVLTDYNMPQMDGLTLAEKIKNTDPLIQVILLTGTCRDILEQEINIIYIDEILSKPFTLDALDSLVEKCTARNRISDSFEPLEKKLVSCHPSIISYDL